MRIALVSHEYPPFRGGGIGTYATVMSRAMAQAGHEVHVITNRFSFGSKDPLHQEPLRRDGNLWVHRLDALTDEWEPKPPHDHPRDLYGELHRHWSPYLYYAELVSQHLERVCDEHDVEVVEVPECAAEGYMAIRRKRLRLAFSRQPFTVTLHSPIYEIYQYNLYSRHNIGFQRRTMMEEYSIRHADAVNSPSRLLAEMVYDRLQLAAGHPPCDVIPLPMDFSSLPSAEELAHPAGAGGDPKLLFVGRLEPRKGVRFLVDAAVQVMQRHPSLKVFLVGRDCDAGEAPGSMTAFLRRRIPAALRPQFVFPGPLPRKELFARYAGVTACVFAAPWDNFPLTCVEAMSSGACVIASDYTGMAEMIEDGKSGLLFRAQDVKSLAAAIQRVIDEPELVSRIRAEAPRRIREVCDPAAAVRNRIAHYERAIEAHRHKSRRRVFSVPSGQRLALFVSGDGGEDAVRNSIESARASAEEACLDLDVTVARSSGHDNNGDPHGDCGSAATEGDGKAAALHRWFEHVERIRPDYLMTLCPGETLEPVYFKTVQSVLATEPRVAWATTWCLPAPGHKGTPYAGFDFSIPLEVLGYHPVPYAVIRYDAFRRVGGWNLDLPDGWRRWDLWIALECAGFSGVVVPCWLSRFVPRAEYTLQPPPPELLTQILEKIVARSPEAFARHGTTLWLYRTMNSVVTTPSDVTTNAAESADYWQEWRQFTKACLKRRFPRTAHFYRQWIKRQGA